MRWASPETLNGSVVAGYRVEMREVPADAADCLPVVHPHTHSPGGSGGGGWTTVFIGVTAAAMSFKATRLKPASRYEFRVAADTTEGSVNGGGGGGGGGGGVGSSPFSVAASVATPYRWGACSLNEPQAPIKQELELNGVFYNYK